MNKVTRNTEIITFLLNRKGSLSDAANTFGISRQRVHQIFDRFLKPKRESISRKGVRGKSYEHTGKNSVYGLGMLGQEMFEEECANRGFEFYREWEKNNYDYRVKEHRVEVKYSSGRDLGEGIEAYNFTFKKNDFDILAACLSGNNWIFFKRGFLDEYKGGGLGIRTKNFVPIADKIIKNSYGWDIFNLKK